MLSTRGEKRTFSAATSRYIGSSAAMQSSMDSRRAISSLLRTSIVALGDFEQPRRPHSAADAHRHDHVLRAAALALDERVAGEARARHSVGMAEGDRPAVHVELVVRDAD